MPRLKNEAVEKAIQLLTNDPLNGVVVKESNADIVEVVRCKDCVYREKDGRCVMVEYFHRHDDDYCSYGERREDAEAD